MKLNDSNGKVDLKESDTGVPPINYKPGPLFYHFRTNKLSKIAVEGRSMTPIVGITWT